jgi:hypothetical protein
MDFQLVSEISEDETIATGKDVRDRLHLRKLYGGTRWRKPKGVALTKVAKDYAFEAARFHPISVPPVVEKALLDASRS